MTKKRSIYLHVTQVAQLDHWLRGVRAMFDTRGVVSTCYLVGSVLTGPDWRDVDVRMMLTDERYKALPIKPKDLGMLVSMWGQHVTGLPIDFQVQSATEWATFDGPVNPR